MTRLTKQLVVQAGIATASDTFFDSGAEASFVGGVKWFSSSERTSLRCVTALGPDRFDQAASCRTPSDDGVPGRPARMRRAG
jgi:hypothetical protein